MSAILIECSSNSSRIAIRVLSWFNDTGQNHGMSMIVLSIMLWLVLSLLQVAAIEVFFF